ncbi:MAG: excinuclease ABC subunit UvrA, partial [bacterium]|nr:excinuclease ABC subunit UvrA [bacterium]
MDKKIIIRKASEHNLKSVDVNIPHGHLTVVTGVSGSGKSSLVFDTICKEGQRRYLESFSAYARQFLGKMRRPTVGHISGLSPAIAIDQKTVVRNPRSTVGTMSECYDYLRLLFARLGTVEKTDNDGTPHGNGNNNPGSNGKGNEKETGNGDLHIEEKETPKLERHLFSFNSPHGACPTCKGLGVQDRIDTELLISDPSKSPRQGALVITTPTGYIIYSQVTMDVLNQVCEAHGFNVDIPWQDMADEQKRIVLYGSDIIKIPYGKHPLESRLKWSGITAKPREEGHYKGIIPVMEHILRVDRNKNILRFARSFPCENCGGTRLKKEALDVHFKGKNIAQYAHMTVSQLDDFFRDCVFSASESAVGEVIREAMLQRTALLKQLGLGYLTLERESTTLSGGEAQRIRLATQVGTGLRGILYILDEPSIGLHQRDNERLLHMMRLLRDGGNTVVAVEHDEDTMLAADRLIDIGPAAGTEGGEILFNGPIEDIFKGDDTDELLSRSRTRAFLTGKERIEIPTQRRQGKDTLLTVKGAKEHNLKNIDVSFKLGVLNVVTGVSGAGKSTLVHDILANALRSQLHNANTQAGEHDCIEGVEEIDKIIEIDQTPIGRTPRSNPATYTKLFDFIRDLFASLPEAKERQWGKGRFSFNVKGGRCESCEGAGLKQIGMHFMGNVDVLCEDCGGKRFNDETLEVRYKDRNIYEVLEMPIDEAVEFFSHQAKISRFLLAMQDLGLGYISLGQSSTTLSGGEAQRIKLAAELNKPATGKTLYILDEPTTGLHAADIKILLQSLNRLVDKGNTVITVEHHPDFIKVADNVIDLGPESGTEGGFLVAAGTPEEVAENKDSLTGAALKNCLRRPRAPRHGESLAGQNGSNRSLATSDPGYMGARLAVDSMPGAGPGNEGEAGKGKVPAAHRAEEPIVLKGVCTHNLKNVDVEIPVNKLTVITGVSGSGKSSLAFDTLFAEGRRRFFTSFSTYARRMMANLKGADMDECFGLMPTIAISQKAAARNPRSTVGTMTEIYDYYRLLFARVGIQHCPVCRTNSLCNGVPRGASPWPSESPPEGPPAARFKLNKKATCPACDFKGHETLLSSMFSFNHHQGACTTCKGLGIVTLCDSQKLVTNRDKSLLDGALDGSKTGKFYGDPHGQYTAILKTVGEERNIDFSVPWDELNEDARDIAMFGTGETTYNVNWEFKRKNRVGEHKFETPWLGFANHVNEEYERKHADKRGQAMLPLMTDRECPQCKGRRLKPEFLAVTFAGLDIAQLCSQTVEQSIAFFNQYASGGPPRGMGFSPEGPKGGVPWNPNAVSKPGPEGQLGFQGEPPLGG